MRRQAWVAAISTVVSAVLGLTWLGLFAVQPLLGFEDTDDPALGVAFVRAHPQVFALTGLALVVMAIALTISVASISEDNFVGSQRWPVTATTAAGLGAAVCFLVFGAMRVGASGPLLHIAGLSTEWGETVYLVVQIAGVQGVLPAGLLGLALWATGVSLLGLARRALPVVICVLGVVPALHVLVRLLGSSGLLPDGAWFILAASIPGTMLWCLALGFALVVRALRGTSTARERRPGRSGSESHP
ncbi:MAG TPA: hypothetical protein VGK18_03705 [Propionicimonas sp.]|uniref:hypothetical protein n=1 Tax=Propionicimonas sp. TaxID=1955623 RepID=UPI002F3F6227